MTAKTLPVGHKIVPGPNPKFRFVLMPNGKLCPNQGTWPTDRVVTDQDIIDDFHVYLERNKAKS